MGRAKTSPRIWTTRRRLCGLALACTLSCSASTRTSNVQALFVSTTDTVNSTMAVAVDIVILYDEDILAKLPMQSPTWFAQRGTFVADHALNMDVIELELPPGITALEVDLPRRSRVATDVVLFANYISKDGQSRQDLSDLRCVSVALGQEKARLSNRTPSKKTGPCKSR